MDGFVGSWPYLAIMGTLLVVLVLAVPAIILIIRLVLASSRKTASRRRRDDDDDYEDQPRPRRRPAKAIPVAARVATVAIVCPHCQAAAQVPVSEVGNAATCAACGKSIGASPPLPPADETVPNPPLPT
jgi:uncharacterized paraquat-inducible protein A